MQREVGKEVGRITGLEYFKRCRIQVSYNRVKTLLNDVFIE